ncbi:tail fiber domain-containing protein, partial [Lutibacter sp.]
VKNSNDMYAFSPGKVGIGTSTPASKLDIVSTGSINYGVNITHTHAVTNDLTTALRINSETSTASNVYGAYVQVRNSATSYYSTGIYAFNSANAHTNIGMHANASGSGTYNVGVSGAASGSTQNIGGDFTVSDNYGLNNYAIKAMATGGSNSNWAGYFGNGSYAGSGNVYVQDLLRVDGMLQYTHPSVSNGFILKTDASGNATWTNPSTIDNQNLTSAVLTGTSLKINIENGTSATVNLGSLLQNITGSSLSGTNLTIGIQNGSSQVVDLAPLQDADWYEAGDTPPNSISDNIYTYGSVGIGATPSYAFDVQRLSSFGYVAQIYNTSTNTAADGLRIKLGNTSPGTSNYFIGFISGNNGIKGKITGNTTTGGVTYATTSDGRLKTNIVSITNALSLINTIKPRIYEFKSNRGIKEYGFIAQELIKVLPQAVSGDPNSNVETDPMMVDYSRVTPLLTAGIQELKKEVDKLKEENKILKDKLKKYELLEERIKALEEKMSAK